MQTLSEGISACVPGLPQSGIMSSERMYQGPTHMAFLYF